MKSKLAGIQYLPIVLVVFVILFAFAFGLHAAASKPPGADIQMNSPPDVSIEQVDVRAGASAPSTSAPETAASPGTPLPDGPTLLGRYCARCHQIERLEQVEKSPSEWEKTLEQMEAKGVHPDDSEKAVLLDYLAGSR